MYTANIRPTPPMPRAVPCRNSSSLLGYLKATTNTFRHRPAALSSERVSGHVRTNEVRPLRLTPSTIY